MKVKVRIAVAVDSTGQWSAYGSLGMDDRDAMSLAIENVEEHEARYFVETELDVPEVVTATITDAAVELDERR